MKKNGYHGSGLTCPKCQRTAAFHSHRPKTFVTLLGPVRLSRAYYHCGRDKGFFPFDDAATRTGRGLSRAAEEVAAMAGVVDDSFAEAATHLLLKLAGIRLGESTVERVTEEAGAVVGQELAGGCTFGADKAFDWHKDNQGRTVAYITADATGVAQQGRKGAKAEGRMPYVAMVYNPPPDRPEGTVRPKGQPAVMQARYLAGLYKLPLLGLILRRQAAQVGMEKAQVWIGISDGGSGLEDFLRSNFNRPDRVVILDFYHPASRLEELARCWHESDAKASGALAGEWCKLLKAEGGEALLARLRSQPPPGHRQALVEKYTEMVGYVENHQHKMDYPRYVREGWQIGSGPVESGCKTVVGQRLKQAGMRWGPAGTDAMCHLRALLKSGPQQWDAFWDRRVNKGSFFYQTN